MFADYHPEFAFLRLYDAATNQLAMVLDSAPGTRPIHGAVVAEEDPFDLMSYNKAGIVLAMLRRIVGPDGFRIAVRAFTNRFAHASADTADARAAFGAATHTDLSHFFDVWIYRPGFPLIVVDQKTLRQMPFADAEERIWELPLRVRAGVAAAVVDHEIVLREEEIDLSFDADWIIVNPGMESFCRVWYSGDAFTAAVDAVARGAIGEYDRRQFVAEQTFLSSRGFVGEDEIAYMRRRIP
jgi:puromycin-sensitive aminopeptidase